MTDRTAWYPWPLKPSREGWYEYRGFMLPDPVMMYWNGVQFGYDFQGHWVHMADDERDEWRGLTEPA